MLFRSRARKGYHAFINDEEILEKKDVYRTIDKRIMGDEIFLDKVIKKSNADIVSYRKTKEYSLTEISETLERECDISLELLRGKGKSLLTTKGKKLFSVIANEYGYSGREIAHFVEKDPSVISRYLKEKGELKKESDEVIQGLCRS